MESREINVVPPFYDAGHAGDFSYTPDRMAVFNEANRFRKEFEIPPAAADSKRIDLLLIDVQRDFCHPEGTLYVGGRSGQGAVGDNRRIAEFIYRNLARITHIRCTLDSHNNFQIFFPWFWTDSQGEPLAPIPSSRSTAGTPGGWSISTPWETCSRRTWSPTPP